MNAFVNDAPGVLHVRTRGGSPKIAVGCLRNRERKRRWGVPTMERVSLYRGREDMRGPYLMKGEKNRGKGGIKMNQGESQLNKGYAKSFHRQTLGGRHKPNRHGEKIVRAEKGAKTVRGGGENKLQKEEIKKRKS